jgi:hypothetical protein
VALAWPHTWCKQAGGWYDPLLRFLGINHSYYYKAGHAALIIVGIEQEKCFYFDFGRYHAPWHHGRVRDEISDTDLSISIKPEFDREKKNLTNLKDILHEMQKNPSYHGDGPVHASQIPGNFDKAYSKAKSMQERVFIPYGPFVMGGTNCSRFVSQVIRKGNIPFRNWLRMFFLVPLTPTPMSNMNSLHQKIKVPKSVAEEAFQPMQISGQLKGKSIGRFLKTTKSAPDKPLHIPPGSQWLSGEGAGSWFYVNPSDNLLEVVRYSPQGAVECKEKFTFGGSNGFDPKQDYTISYPSDCQRISLRQKNALFSFSRHK